MQVFLLVLHVLVAVLLVVAILIQRGRGGGLLESFSGVESMFGTKTSQFLTRITAVLATIFLFTSISLALFAARQSRSLIGDESILPPQEGVVGEDILFPQEEVVEEGIPFSEEEAVEEQPMESEMAPAPVTEEEQEQGQGVQEQ